MARRSTMTRLSMAAVALVTAAACSQAPQSPLAPSAAVGGSLANEAVATLKVTPPVPESPRDGVRIDNRRPVFRFANAAGRFVVPAQGVYEIALMDASGAVIARYAVDGDPGGGTSFTQPTDLAWERDYSWRVRFTLEGAASEWSGAVTFRTPDEPRARLPFPIPAACGAVADPTGDRSACIAAVSLVSPQWPSCRGGNKVACFRFTWHAAAALAAADQRYGMLTKNPGDTQCNWNWCGHGDGTGLGEDVVTYLPPGAGVGSGWVGWDIVGGAGAPGATAHWARLTARRPGNQWIAVPPLPQ